jgi:hypothetical protein
MIRNLCLTIVNHTPAIHIMNRSEPIDGIPFIPHRGITTSGIPDRDIQEMRLRGMVRLCRRVRRSVATIPQRITMMIPRAKQRNLISHVMEQ